MKASVRNAARRWQTTREFAVASGTDSKGESLVDVLQKIDEAHREIPRTDETFVKSAALSRPLPQHSMRCGNEEQKTNTRSSDLNQSDQTTPDTLSVDCRAGALV